MLNYRNNMFLKLFFRVGHLHAVARPTKWLTVVKRIALTVMNSVTGHRLVNFATVNAGTGDDPLEFLRR